MQPGGAVDVERTVTAVGLIGLGGKRYCIGTSLAGLRVTLRLDGTVMHVLGKAVPCWPPCPARFRSPGSACCRARTRPVSRPLHQYPGR